LTLFAALAAIASVSRAAGGVAAPKANLSIGAGAPVAPPVMLSPRNGAGAPLADAPVLNLNGGLVLPDAAVFEANAPARAAARVSMSRSESSPASRSATSRLAPAAVSRKAAAVPVRSNAVVADASGRTAPAVAGESANATEMPASAKASGFRVVLSALGANFRGAGAARLRDHYDRSDSASRASEVASVSAESRSRTASGRGSRRAAAALSRSGEFSRNAADAESEPPAPVERTDAKSEMGGLRSVLGRHWKTFAAMGGILAALGGLFFVAEPLVEMIAATEMTGLNFTTGAIAVLAGVLSFASPCTLPLLPGFMATISGLSYDKMQDSSASRMWRTGMSSLAFVAGASTIFLAMGALASTVGAFLFGNMPVISKFAGGLLVLFGLHTMGVKIPWLSSKLNTQKQMDSSKVWGNGYLKAFLIGTVFAIGWSPCIGPILGMILGLASTAGVAQGTALLGLYSVGLGIPFVLTGLFIDRFQSIFSQAKKMFGWRERIAGAIMILLGAVLAFGDLAALTDGVMRLIGLGA
jgi:cytochrome c-type biogenesis protein